MRINVYSQELTDEVISLSKESNTGIVYHAAQLILHSSPMLHHPPADDDRSAVTFWLPGSPERREKMAQAFEKIAAIFRAAPDSSRAESGDPELEPRFARTHAETYAESRALFARTAEAGEGASAAAEVPAASAAVEPTHNFAEPTVGDLLAQLHKARPQPSVAAPRAESTATDKIPASSGQEVAHERESEVHGAEHHRVPVRREEGGAGAAVRRVDPRGPAIREGDAGRGILDVYRQPGGARPTQAGEGVLHRPDAGAVATPGAVAPVAAVPALKPVLPLGHEWDGHPSYDGCTYIVEHDVIAPVRCGRPRAEHEPKEET